MAPVPHNPAGYLKNPQLPRKSETIGGGYFIFRRGDGTKRIRPSKWPFEYGNALDAVREAKRLAALHPGYRFDVIARIESIQVEPEAAQVASAVAALGDEDAAPISEAAE